MSNCQKKSVSCGKRRQNLADGGDKPRHWPVCARAGVAPVTEGLGCWGALCPKSGTTTGATAQRGSSLAPAHDFRHAGSAVSLLPLRALGSAAANGQPLSGTGRVTTWGALS